MKRCRMVRIDTNMYDFINRIKEENGLLSFSEASRVLHKRINETEEFMYGKDKKKLRDPFRIRI